MSDSQTPDPRKPIFDAVRTLARPGLFNDRGNIHALNNLLDAFNVPRAAAPPQKDVPMKLSPNFTLAEMTRSQTASRRGIDNTPTPAALEALKLLCHRVLEPVRAHFKRPVIVTSGYRSPAVNSAIGGSATSQHSQGEAADFTVHGISNLEVCRWIEAQLNYDQLIYEFGESGWIHVSDKATRLRNMELSAVRRGGKTVYLPGLVP